MKRELFEKLAEISIGTKGQLQHLLQQEALPLTLFQMKVVSFVGRFPGQPQKRLVQSGVDKGQVARTFKELEERGIIRRCGDSTEKRITEAELTEEGHDYFVQLEAIRSRVAEKVLAGLDSDEQAALGRLLSKMRDNLSQG